MERLPKFKETLFDNEHMACGINAIIEVFHLPVEKIYKLSTVEISRALVEISGRESFFTGSFEKLNTELKRIIGDKCVNPHTLEKVMGLYEDKYHTLKETGNLN